MGLKKQDSIVCCLQETHFHFKDTQAQSEGVGKDTHQVKTTREQGLHSNKDLKGETDNNTVIFEDFSVPLLTKDGSRQKTKETLGVFL